ncbi:MAG: hypothetical protein PHR32_08930 [Candidatus Cloacimonetes bacterium]|jgi:glutathione synthase/RimK-type ligase-like ATP-grasp enzyme|nr:hypothetical protein [Candidatus Cloacimonadota bacterium]
MKRETYYQRYIKGLLKSTRLGQYYRSRRRLKLGKLFSLDKSIDDLFPEVPNVKIKGTLDRFPKIGIHKDPTEYNGYGVLASYYLRYKRFLDFNLIPHTIIDLKKSDWLEQCEDLDIIVVAYESEPSRLNELQAKIGILDTYHGKLCYPSAKDLWSYEDKVRIFYLVKEHGLGHADTFISHDYEEAVEYTKKANYPLVSKIKTGSCSRGVELVKDKKRALQIVKQNFGLGRKALWTYSFEKDYVYFQEFIKDASYDLRISIVGDIIAGYQRRMPGKDFRASGAGLMARALLPQGAIMDALALKEKWDATVLGVDFVDSNNSQEHKIIEASISMGLDYPEYLENDGKRVFYVNTPQGVEMREGCFWLQEFILLELIKKWYKENESSVCIEWELVFRDQPNS